MKNESYKHEIAEFKMILADIGAEHGWTLADLKARFSNDFFDDFYFDDVGETKSNATHFHSSNVLNGKTQN